MARCLDCDMAHWSGCATTRCLDCDMTHWSGRDTPQARLMANRRRCWAPVRGRCSLLIVAGWAHLLAVRSLARALALMARFVFQRGDSQGRSAVQAADLTIEVGKKDFLPKARWYALDPAPLAARQAPGHC